MTNSTGTVLRGDLNAVVEEAAAAERYFIAQKVMPMLSVPTKNGQYPKLTKTATELLNAGSTIRQPRSEYARTARQWTSDTYDCLDRGLEEAVDDAEAKDLARYTQLEQLTARLVLRAMMLDYETRVSAAIMNSSTFTATSAAVNYTETLIATINLPKDITNAIERLMDKGVQPNTIVMSSTLLAQQKRATLTQNFVRGNRPSDSQLTINASALQAAFSDQGITQVLVGRSRYNSAKKGQAFSATNCWPNTYIWVGEVQSGPAEGGGAGRTFVWNAEGGLFVTETYREDNKRSNIVRVRQHTTEKIIDASAGELITTNYSAS